MSAIDTFSLFQAGPQAVFDAVTKDPSIPDDALCQACSREARFAADDATALAWAEAGILCYSSLAASLPEGFVRSGREEIAYGLRSVMILKLGAEYEQTRRWLQQTEAWLAQVARPYSTPQGLFEALSIGDPDAALAQIHLKLGIDLWQKGLLSDTLAPWISAVAGRAE